MNSGSSSHTACSTCSAARSRSTPSNPPAFPAIYTFGSARFGHRGNAEADEVDGLVCAGVETEIVCGSGLYLNLAGREGETDVERALLVHDAGVADVDRAGDDADARLAPGAS